MLTPGRSRNYRERSLHMAAPDCRKRLFPKRSRKADGAFRPFFRFAKKAARMYTSDKEYTPGLREIV